VPSEIISKLEEIASKAPKLVLTIKDSLFLKVGLRIKINALGLEGNSLRNKKDGFTYFGLMAPNERESDINIDFSTSDITNNINNYKDEPIQYGRQFRIRFDINKSCYYIKDCSNGSGYGSFMKIINQIKIKDKTLINIGGNYLAFSFGTNDYEQLDDEANEKENGNENENESILTIIVFSGESNNISYVFNQNQTNKIYIGKNENCNIVLNDDFLDDFHCTVEYKNKLGWVINDGYNNKKSEAGTWFGLSEERKIVEGMIIQSNQNIYECHITE